MLTKKKIRFVYGIACVCVALVMLYSDSTRLYASAPCIMVTETDVRSDEPDLPNTVYAVLRELMVADNYKSYEYLGKKIDIVQGKIFYIFKFDNGFENAIVKHIIKDTAFTYQEYLGGVDYD